MGTAYQPHDSIPVAPMKTTVDISDPLLRWRPNGSLPAKEQRSLLIERGLYQACVS